MKTLKLLAVTLATATALGLSFGAFAQDATPQEEDPALTAAAIAVNKLAMMGNDGAFPLTQDEINAAANYLIDQAKSDGQTLTRDQAIIGIGYLAGSLAAFLDMERSGALPPPEGAPEEQVPPPPEFGAPAPIPPAPGSQPVPAPAAPAAAPAPVAPAPAPAK